MMKRLILSLLVLGVGLGGVNVARGGTVTCGGLCNLTFTLSSNGIVGGLPGTTQGWGFTLTNTTNYVVIDASEFDITQNGGDGTYLDFVGPNFIVVGPTDNSASPVTGPTVSQNFDPVNVLGAGSFAISPTATIGDVVLGTITLTFDVYSVSPNDPSFNPFADWLASGFQISVPAEVLVTPEAPSLFLLLTAAGMALLILPRLARTGA